MFKNFLNKVKSFKIIKVFKIIKIIKASADFQEFRGHCWNRTCLGRFR